MEDTPLIGRQSPFDFRLSAIQQGKLSGQDQLELLSAATTVGTADEIKQLFLDFQSVNITFFQTLKKQPWGATNFIIKDPDGNLR